MVDIKENYCQIQMKLIEIEMEYPDLKSDNSPTVRVGGDVSEGFEKVKHNIPMLSIGDVFNEDEILLFDERIKKEGYKPEYVCELKIDGLAISLTYELINSVDEYSDRDFVIKLFAQGMVIYWMRPQVESAINMATIIGGKEEKRLLSNYKTVIERLDKLEVDFKKLLRDHEYWNGDIVTT